MHAIDVTQRSKVRVENFIGEITSKLSERPLKYADQKTERGKILNPEYSICRDQPTSRASPLRINVLLSRRFRKNERMVSVAGAVNDKS